MVIQIVGEGLFAHLKREVLVTRDGHFRQHRADLHELLGE
jgi:hypothetical protein